MPGSILNRPIRLVEGGHLNREHRQFSEYSTQRGKLLQTCPAPLKDSEEASVDGAQLLAVGDGGGSGKHGGTGQLGSVGWTGTHCCI